MNIVLLICLLDVRMSPAKRELRKSGSNAGSSQTDSMSAQTNPPVRNDASSSSEDHDSCPVGTMDESALDVIMPL
ncbi:hypothetical protein T01_10697 [Trichinella spiralis]|uniref:Uncharacterized protein n=1 Tax=Trichinella spiralis TaxID=6334 RepID=A0A0V1B1S6_TRISP|nr:hypothetical protein T01_10697 [Trichinella spiralis]